MLGGFSDIRQYRQEGHWLKSCPEKATTCLGGKDSINLLILRKNVFHLRRDSLVESICLSRATSRWDSQSRAQYSSTHTQTHRPSRLPKYKDASKIKNYGVWKQEPNCEAWRRVSSWRAIKSEHLQVYL